MNAEREELLTIIGEQAGAVSACWSELSSAGIFQSERAASYVNEAVERILAAGYVKKVSE